MTRCARYSNHFYVGYVPLPMPNAAPEQNVHKLVQMG